LGRTLEPLPVEKASDEVKRNYEYFCFFSLLCALCDLSGAFSLPEYGRIFKSIFGRIKKVPHKKIFQLLT
jgi:hypothetical protein